jgi:hypothetical protein
MIYFTLDPEWKADQDAGTLSNPSDGNVTTVLQYLP